MTFLPSSRLLSERNFGLFWLAGLISIIGDWALRIALPIYVLRLTGSASAVSVVVLAGLVAGLAAGPVAGVCADRLDRRRVLVSVSSAQAAALAPLLIAGPATPAWLVAAVAAAEAALAEVAEPAASALLPGLVPRRELAAANSLNSVANFVARLTGPAAGGALTAVAGVRGAAALDAATFVAAATGYGLIRGMHRTGHAARPKRGLLASLARLRGELADGFVAIARSRMGRAVAIFITTISIGEGMVSSLFAVWVTRSMHMGGRQLGWMLSAQAVGGIAGSLAGAAAFRRFRPVGLGCICMALFGLGDLAIFNAPRWHGALVPVLALFFCIGVPAGAGYPAVMTLFQLAAPDRLRGRMFAVLGFAETGANIAGAAVAGALDQHVSAVDLLTAQGAGYVLAAALLRVLAGRGPRRLGDAVGADEVDEVRARGQRSARRGRRPDQIRSPSS